MEVAIGNFRLFPCNKDVIDAQNPLEKIHLFVLPPSCTTQGSNGYSELEESVTNLELEFTNCVIQWSKKLGIENVIKTLK